MASTWCAAPNSPAYALVGNAQQKFMQLGDDLYRLTVDNMNGLDTTVLNPVDFNVNFDFNGQLAQFQRPLAPTLNTGDFAFRMPAEVGAPPTYIGNTPNIANAPTFNGQPPVFNFAATPARPNITTPLPPQVDTNLEMPLEPTYMLPVVPTLRDLQLPDMPELDIPQFTSQLPEFTEPPFDDSWTFNPTPYVSELKDKLLAALDPMLKCKEALPQAIEQAIFNRMRSRIETEGGRARDEAFNEMAIRGFSTPAGPLAAKLANIRRETKDNIAQAARDAAIEQYKTIVENLRAAIVQGTALEGVYSGIHIEEQRYALEAARFQRESTIAILNYRLSVYQARMQGYQIEAQVLRDRIQAELAKVEVFRAQIEAQRLIGDINEQDVRLYATQVQSVNALADFYRTRVEAVKTKADVIRLQFDRYRTEMDAFDIRWKAYATEWQGYTASVEGEGKRADLYRSMIQAYATDVDAWRAKQGFAIDLERLKINQNGQALQAWQALLANRASNLEAERARLQAVSSLAGAQAQLYTAGAQVESAASAAIDRSFQLGLERANANVAAQFKNVELRINQMQMIMQQLLAVADTKVKVGAQLAASSWSAVNYSAGVSASVGQSSSCSSNFNFQGEIIDA